MIYKISDEILNDFPMFTRGVVIASQVNNAPKQLAALEEMLATKSEEIRIDDSITIDHPKIRKWFDVYKRFGADVNQNPPSIANLIRRIKQGKHISFISPIVAIINIISLTYLVPSGGIDATTVKGDLVLGKAQGNEAFIPLGREKPVRISPGEVIFYDNLQKNVICRAWNSRAGQFTIISPSTTSVIVDVDGMIDIISRPEIIRATEFLAALIKEYCGGNIRIEYLSSERNEITI